MTIGNNKLHSLQKKMNETCTCCKIQNIDRSLLVNLDKKSFSDENDIEKKKAK